MLQVDTRWSSIVLLARASSHMLVDAALRDWLKFGSVVEVKSQ